MAVEQALTNDLTLDVVLGVDGSNPHKIFDTSIPEGLTVTPPYVILGSTTENPSDVFHRGGSRGTLQLHVWSAQHGKLEIGWVYTELKRILHRQPLVLSGGMAWLEGSITTGPEFRDDGSGMMHGVATYTYTVRG
jgi:hypothetical protein